MRYCPACYSQINNMTATLGGNSIRPDDYGMCMSCGRFLRFDKTLKLHLVKPKDIPRNLEKELIRVKILWLQEREKEFKC